GIAGAEDQLANAHAAIAIRRRQGRFECAMNIGRAPRGVDARRVNVRSWTLFPCTVSNNGGGESFNTTAPLGCRVSFPLAELSGGKPKTPKAPQENREIRTAARAANLLRFIVILVTCSLLRMAAALERAMATGKRLTRHS